MVDKFGLQAVLPERDASASRTSIVPISAPVASGPSCCQGLTTVRAEHRSSQREVRMSFPVRSRDSVVGLGKQFLHPPEQTSVDERLEVASYSSAKCIDVPDVRFACLLYTSPSPRD